MKQTRSEYMKAYRKKWYQKNKKRSNEKSKLYYQKHRTRLIEKNSKSRDGLRIRERKYGLAKGEFTLLLETQAGQCAACHLDLTVLPSKDVHVDHCHETGRVRGILCRPCNLSLGLMQEDAVALRRLADYLERYT